ncbi:helix-turn-helix transcriptional regulator [Gymnodinialimonas ulvae]|uniref:helix-turn-helix transcriptional regulator n=1 Tax=Gymnodinialimonas ulvae TaxID=3126504 RepID=UPI0030AD0A92
MPLSAILEKLGKVTRRRDLWCALLDYLHAKGIQSVSYHTTGPDNKTADIVADGFPDKWICSYIKKRLVQIDPMPTLAAQLARPFFWHEVYDLTDNAESTHRYMELLNAANLGDGLALYVFGPGLQNAYVGLGFGDNEITLTPEDVLEIQCVVQAAHLRFLDLSSDGRPANPLTPREHEVLDWVARGKSNGVIAEILGTSPHTVDTHIRAIYRKLNVTDRTSAALKAVSSGLLQYPSERLP